MTFLTEILQVLNLYKLCFLYLYSLDVIFARWKCMYCFYWKNLETTISSRGIHNGIKCDTCLSYCFPDYLGYMAFICFLSFFSHYLAFKSLGFFICNVVLWSSYTIWLWNPPSFSLFFCSITYSIIEVLVISRIIFFNWNEFLELNYVLCS